MKQFYFLRIYSAIVGFLGLGGQLQVISAYYNIFWYSFVGRVTGKMEHSQVESLVGLLGSEVSFNVTHIV